MVVYSTGIYLLAWQGLLVHASVDHPDIPLLINSTKFIIMLDLLVISRFHVSSFTLTVNTQALIRLACDMTSALSGLAYFIYIAFKLQRQSPNSEQSVKPKITVLKILARPSVYIFTKSAIRNAFYLWLVSKIILLGENYVTVWDVFNTIR
jgi:hypothetical protein